MDIKRQQKQYNMHSQNLDLQSSHLNKGALTHKSFAKLLHFESALFQINSCIKDPSVSKQKSVFIFSPALRSEFVRDAVQGGHHVISDHAGDVCHGVPLLVLRVIKQIPVMIILTRPNILGSVYPMKYELERELIESLERAEREGLKSCLKLGRKMKTFSRHVPFNCQVKSLQRSFILRSLKCQI